MAPALLAALLTLHGAELMPAEMPATRVSPGCEARPTVPVWVDARDLEPGCRPGGAACRARHGVRVTLRPQALPGGGGEPSEAGVLHNAPSPVVFECTTGAPVLADGVLGCPGGAPRLRPDVTLPSCVTSPGAAVPRVRAGDRPVTASLHSLARHLPATLALVAACLLIAVVAGWRLPRSSPLPPTAIPRMERLRLLGLTALAAGLRFTGLGDEPLEQNEFTYVMTSIGHDTPWGVLWDVNALAQTHAPLPHLLSFALAPLGVSEAWLRAPSALAGTLAIPVVFWAAWRLGGRGPAWWAAAFAAVAPVHAWYSQDASPYALVTLFGGAMLVGAESLLRGGRGVLLAAAAVLGFYSHYYALHLALGLYVALLVLGWRDPAQRRRVLRSGGVAGALVALWLPAFLEAYAWSKGHSTAYQREAGVYHPVANLAFDVADALRLVAGVPWFAWPFGVAALGVFAARFGRIRDARSALLLFPLLWFTAFELVNRESFLRGLYDGYYFGIRYALFLFPALWILGGRLAAASRLAMALGAAALVFGAVESVQTLARPDKPDVRAAAREVAGFVRDGDAIVVGPAVFYQHPWHWYAATEAQRQALRVNDLMRTPEWRDGVLGVLTDLVEPYERSLASAFVQRVVLVDHTQHLFGRREFSDRPSRRLEEALRGWRETWRRDLHDVSIRTFVRAEPGVAPPDSLHFGWDDAPWLRAAEPPGPWRSPGRRVRRQTELRVPTGVVVHLRVGAAPMGPVSAAAPAQVTPASLTVSLEGRPVWTGTVTAEFTEIALTVPSGPGDATLAFERGPSPPGKAPSDVVLDTLWTTPLEAGQEATGRTR